ncbi:MAG: cytochrome C [Desulfuromonadales bacterium]|nr:MAG: cytochrome C [Desulfuromonadales bacterium]
MKIAKKDWFFIGLIVVVVGVFYAISGEVRTKKVPYDDKHMKFYEAFQKGQGKIELDAQCPVCHNENGGVPFPKDHPVKPADGPMRCLFCHKFKQK